MRKQAQLLSMCKQGRLLRRGPLGARPKGRGEDAEAGFLVTYLRGATQ